MIMSSNGNPINVVRDGNEWVFSNGKRLPVVSGAADGDGIVVDVPGEPAAPAPTAKMFTEEEVTAIRRQEKDKLYGEIDKMKADAIERAATLETQLQVFKDEKEELTKVSAAQAEAEAAERKAREEAEMSAKELLLAREDEMETKINEVQNEWESKFNKLQQESQQQSALLDQERAFQALETYKNRRVQEEQGDIMPELMDLVAGGDEAAIEASILAAKAKTSAIMESIQEGQAALRAPRGVPATGSSPTGPMEDQTSQQTLSADQIRNLSNDQYAQLRDQLLPQASR